MSDNSQPVVTLIPSEQPKEKSAVESIVMELNKPKVEPVKEILGAEGESIDKPIEEPVVETKEEELLSARFAALSRREKALTDREKQYKEFEEKSKRFEQAIQSIKTNPLEALKEIGIDFEEFVSLVLQEGEQNQELTPDQKIAKKIEDLENKLQKKDEDDARNKEELESNKIKEDDEYIEKSIQNFKNTIKSFVEDNQDAYELIHIHNAQETVYEVIETVFQDTGKTPELQEVCDQVEEYLTAQANKLMGLKKFNKEQNSKVEDLKTNKTLIENKASPTLTNTMTPTTAPKADGRLLSTEESLKKAASLIKWS